MVGSAVGSVVGAVVGTVVGSVVGAVVGCVGTVAEGCRNFSVEQPLSKLHTKAQQRMREICLFIACLPFRVIRL